MLGCNIVVFCILGAWMVSALVFFILRASTKKKLPKGSIILKNQIQEEKITYPSSKITRIVSTIALSSSSVFFLFIIFSCILNVWDKIPYYMIINLPIWLNIIGIIGIWLCYAWGVFVMKYNVNYTALYKPLQGHYILVTGGPYKYVRHPMYIEKFAVIFFIFLTTGFWVVFIFLIGFFWIPLQAKGEEQLLLDLFGEDYQKYLEKTGRFFPKIKVFQRNED